jgi:endonuclease/exonuclease/phosphatase (EEP) superfamily protein YafD
VLVSEDVDIVATKRGKHLGSDHLPLVVTFTF